MHGNDRSTSQISVGWIDLFDDNIENIMIRTKYRLKVSTISETVQSPTNLAPFHHTMSCKPFLHTV